VINNNLSVSTPVFGRQFFLFFFSSRRRHTRFSRDWSSDVCSSDLLLAQGAPQLVEDVERHELRWFRGRVECREESHLRQTLTAQIGRASCRERAESSGVGVSVKERTK